MVVYPAFGVAKLSREVVKKIDFVEIYFYELNFINKDVKILIPRENINSVGLRNLSSKEEIEDVFKSFFLTYSDSWFNDISLMSWNRRSKDYQAKIRCGNIREMAKIYRDLKYIEKGKILSFGEKNVLNQVEEFLAEEVAVIYEKDIKEVVFFLRDFIANFIINPSINYDIENIDLNGILSKQIYNKSFLEK
jgi:CarD family transcriptional regulator